MADKEIFQGFSVDTLRFLNGIVHNNSKTWLEENRCEYETSLLLPMKSLVTVLAPALSAIDPGIDTRAMVGRTISRIFRDVRFSRDKSPLRPNMWIVFKRPGDEGLHIPTFYFDLSFDHFSYGMGFYSATPEYMKQLRSRILSNPDRIIDAMDKIDKGLILHGDEYKRPPVKTFPENISQEQLEKIKPLLNKKSFYWAKTESPGDLLFEPYLVDVLKEAFESLTPIYNYLLKSV